MTLPLELRPYQKAAVEAIGDGVLLVAPTGVGKTLMMVMAARKAIAEGKRVLWVAHREELLFQAARTAGDTGMAVASVQSVRRGWKGPRIDVLIVDEAHHLPADDWSLLLEEQFPMAELWGATATPERSDGRGLGALFRAMHVAISIPDAVAAGYLVPSDVLRPDRAMKPGELAEEPLKAYEKNAKGTKTILFAPTVPIAIQYAQEFTAAGYPARAVFGEMRAEDRRAALADYVAGKVRAAFLSSGDGAWLTVYDRKQLAVAAVTRYTSVYGGKPERPQQAADVGELLVVEVQRSDEQRQVIDLGAVRTRLAAGDPILR